MKLNNIFRIFKILKTTENKYLKKCFNILLTLVDLKDYKKLCQLILHVNFFYLNALDLDQISGKACGYLFKDSFYINKKNFAIGLRISHYSVYYCNSNYHGVSSELNTYAYYVKGEFLFNKSLRSL